MTKNLIKAFSASNILIETNLQRIQNEYEIDLGKTLIKKDAFKDIRLNFGLDIYTDSERMARYYAVFYCIERHTRKIVYDTLEDAFGFDWWKQCVQTDIQGKVTDRIKTDIESGIAMRSTEPIDYTTFGELGQIIDKNWDHFTDKFVNRKATKKVFTNLNLMRGPIAHNSTFVESEAERFNITIEDWIRQQQS